MHYAEGQRQALTREPRYDRKEHTMGLLDSNGVTTEGHKVTHIRVDRIGAATESGLWWVALAFEDGSTKPQGMYVNYDEAAALGAELATRWSVEVQVTKLV